MRDTKVKDHSFEREKGITLVALIITIIILVLLTAVAISTMYNTKILEYAINGAEGYTKEYFRENLIMQQAGSVMDSGVNRIQSILEQNIRE